MGTPLRTTPSENTWGPTDRRNERSSLSKLSCRSARKRRRHVDPTLRTPRLYPGPVIGRILIAPLLWKYISRPQAPLCLGSVHCPRLSSDRPGGVSCGTEVCFDKWVSYVVVVKGGWGSLGLVLLRDNKDFLVTNRLQHIEENIYT